VFFYRILSTVGNSLEFVAEYQVARLLEKQQFLVKRSIKTTHQFYGIILYQDSPPILLYNTGTLSRQTTELQRHTIERIFLSSSNLATAIKTDPPMSVAPVNMARAVNPEWLISSPPMGDPTRDLIKRLLASWTIEVGGELGAYVRATAPIRSPIAVPWVWSVAILPAQALWRLMTAYGT